MNDLIDDKKEIWNSRLSSCIKKTGLTQEKIAYEMNKKYGTSFTQKTISSWFHVGEKRKNSVVGFPKAESMILIADYFGVDVGYLLGETDDETFTMEKAEKYLALNKEAIQAIMDITRPNSSGPLALEMRKSINYLLSSKYFKIWFGTLDDIFQRSCVSEDDIKKFDRLDDAIDYVVGKNDNRLGIINKYDLNGNLISSNDYKYTDALGFTGIVELNDYFYVSTGKRITTSDTDAMIVKYDTDLVYINEESYNGGGVERFNKIIKDSKEHVILIGTSNDSENNYDGLIAKYDSNLRKIAVVTYGDERDDYFNSIINDGNNYLVVGYSSAEDGSYYPKFIKYSDALKVLVTE